MWYVYRIINKQLGGTRRQLIGWVKADDKAAATKRAAEVFEYPDAHELMEVTGDFGRIESVKPTAP